MTRIDTWITGLLVVVIIGLSLHAPFTVLITTHVPSMELAAKAWKEVLLFIALSLCVIKAVQLKKLQLLTRDRLLQLLALYVLLHVILLGFMWQGIVPALAGLLIDLRWVLGFITVYCAVKLVPSLSPVLLKSAIIGAAIIIGFGVLQLFLPHDSLKYIGYDRRETIAPYLTVDQNYDYIRINSTMRGPNPLGAYVMIVLALVLAAAVRGKLLLHTTRQKVAVAALLAACASVLWVTYSRSAQGAAAIAVGIVGVVGLWRLYSWRIIAVFGIVGLMMLGGLYAARESDFVSHVILHEDPNEGNDINSNDGHVDSVALGLERMAAQPLGAGIGSTGSASLLGDGEPIIIENQYLFIAHEVGWLGMALFLVLQAYILQQLWRRKDDWLNLGLFASGVGLLAIGMLLPVLVDDTIAIIWYALAALALAGGRTLPAKNKKH
ncbi:O-antigen ligase family protein [Candidatus Saccharibacteria bacterium]|nr:O-antigen ligase family protein [Candidatus Saccharibacteria bacterium]